jgi:hypothetical protein
MFWMQARLAGCPGGQASTRTTTDRTPSKRAPEDLLPQPIVTPIAPVTMVSEFHAGVFQTLIGFSILERLLPASAPCGNANRHPHLPYITCPKPWYGAIVPTITGPPRPARRWTCGAARKLLSDKQSPMLGGQSKFSFFQPHPAVISPISGARISPEP